MAGLGARRRDQRDIGGNGQRTVDFARQSDDARGAASQVGQKIDDLLR